MAFLIRRKGHSCEPSSQLISFADYGFATVTGFTLFAKNSPPDYFLNAKTLSGFVAAWICIKYAKNDCFKPFLLCKICLQFYLDLYN